MGGCVLLNTVPFIARMGRGGCRFNAPKLRPSSKKIVALDFILFKFS
jgi:hypothetical protein